MAKNTLSTASPMTGETQLSEAPLRKRYALRSMDPIDSVIGAELLNNPPEEGEHIYASPAALTFHDANGETRQFDKIQAVTTGNRASAFGGWKRTSDPAEIEALDKYAAVTADVRKIYPVL